MSADSRPDPLHPTATLLVKLGSALIHAEELTEPGVKAWREQMDALALLPKKRSADV